MMPSFLWLSMMGQVRDGITTHIGHMRTRHSTHGRTCKTRHNILRHQTLEKRFLVVDRPANFKKASSTVRLDDFNSLSKLASKINSCAYKETSKIQILYTLCREASQCLAHTAKPSLEIRQLSALDVRCGETYLFSKLSGLQVHNPNSPNNPNGPNKPNSPIDPNDTVFGWLDVLLTR
jgi:hypothetical protein